MAQKHKLEETRDASLPSKKHKPAIAAKDSKDSDRKEAISNVLVPIVKEGIASQVETVNSASGHQHVTEAEALNQDVQFKQSETETEAASILPPKLHGIIKNYRFAKVSIKASSRVDRKVKVLVDHMSHIDFLDKNCKPGVIVLDARSSDASKLLSVIEIAKREIVAMRSGKWYQYTRVSSEVVTIPRKKLKSGVKKMDSAEVDTEIQQDVNEKLTSSDKDSKLRAIPIMIIYMARVPVPELREEYGEQTNAPIPKLWFQQ